MYFVGQVLFICLLKIHFFNLTYRITKYDAVLCRGIKQDINSYNLPK